MFIGRKKYTRLLAEKEMWKEAHDTLVKVNKLLLNRDISKHFNQAEIKDLISLCHPDKHNNSDKATEITKKLLELKC